MGCAPHDQMARSKLRSMIHHHARVLLFLAACQISSGCASGVSVQKVANTERTFIHWRGVEPNENKNRPGSCLEFSTAATTLNDTNMRAEGGYAGFQAGVEFNNAQRFERMYEVRSVMQFAHAALFRLCEAQRNGDVPQGKFMDVFENALDSVQGLLVAADLSSAVRGMSDLLIRLELERRKLETLEADAERTIRSIKGKICGQFADDSHKAKCQVELFDWARGVLEMDDDTLEKQPPYDAQVRELFERRNLELSQVFKLDFIELMTLVKAYSARRKAGKMIEQNMTMVEAARRGLEAIANLVPALAHHDRVSTKVTPESPDKQAAPAVQAPEGR